MDDKTGPTHEKPSRRPTLGDRRKERIDSLATAGAAAKAGDVPEMTTAATPKAASTVTRAAWRRRSSILFPR